MTPPLAASSRDNIARNARQQSLRTRLAIVRTHRLIDSPGGTRRPALLSTDKLASHTTLAAPNNHPETRNTAASGGFLQSRGRRPDW